MATETVRSVRTCQSVGTNIESVIGRAFPSGVTRADMASFLLGGSSALSRWQHIGVPFAAASGVYLDAVLARPGGRQDSSRLMMICDAGVLRIVWAFRDASYLTDERTAWRMSDVGDLA